jgi:DNA-binding NtrC family response regulator
VHLLLVDDDAEYRATISRRLQRRGHTVQEAENLQSAMSVARTEQFDAAVVDLEMPDGSGVTLLHQLKEEDPALEVLILTGHGSIETAVEAMRQGAYDYLTKPCRFEELETRLAKAIDRGRLSRENQRLKSLVENVTATADMVGQSTAMQDVLTFLRRIAGADHPVVIYGESGTGKELAAQAVHRFSPRAERPLVAINCAAIPEALLESELFGHERGAFTGADKAKMGLFEAASTGTLFIDELGELALGLQAKLLRALETHRIRRVGAIKETPVDVRIVAATNRDLSKEVAAGRFREDLYYRLNVLAVQLPPLRDRRDDIPLLVEHFLRRPPIREWSISSAALEKLVAYPWPGNIRELANVIERAKILADNPVITAAQLPENIVRPVPPVASLQLKPVATAPKPDQLVTIEREHVLAVLQREGGNKSRTATALGLTRRSLYRLLEKYGLTPDGPSDANADS